MNLWSYIAKRILLMLPTLLGVIAITFAVIQFVPGGPVEQAIMELKGQVGAGDTAGGKVSMRSASRKSRRCMASTSRHPSASGKC
jgi:microcin C transport system permease protein